MGNVITKVGVTNCHYLVESTNKKRLQKTTSLIYVITCSYHIPHTEQSDATLSVEQFSPDDSE